MKRFLILAGAFVLASPLFAERITHEAPAVAFGPPATVGDILASRPSPRALGAFPTQSYSFNPSLLVTVVINAAGRNGTFFHSDVFLINGRGATQEILVGFIALKGILSFSTRWILIGVSRDIEFDIRNDLLDRLLVLEPEFYVRNRTGELMSRATNDLNAVRMVLGPGIMYSATTLVTMLMAIVLMFKLSPSLTLWVGTKTRVRT